MTASAFITGVCGVALTAAERAFVREARPWGLILFKRNIETPAQVAALVASFREAVGAEAPVLVDQEGGRVQRLGPPHWPSYPAGAVYGALYERDRAAGLAAARLGARLIAARPSAPRHRRRLPAGRRRAGRGRRSGDRRSRLWRDARARSRRWPGLRRKGLMAGGVLPVLKHMPGHGRAAADSHLKLPVVERRARASSMRPILRPFGRSRRCPWA